MTSLNEYSAAILRYYLGRDGTRRLFGGDSLRSLPQSWLIGMLLPVCSIGVLPILIQMRRSGVNPGAMSAFALSAPLFNPLSLLYGLTLSRPLVIILLAVGSLIIVIALGLFWDALDRRQPAEVATDAEDCKQGLIGPRRLAATFVQIVVLVIVGFIFRAIGIDESRLTLATAEKPDVVRPRRFDIIVPPGVIGATMLAGLVALSVVACYGYYPSTQECLKEIALARAECLSAANGGDKDHALFWLPIWEDWSRRLEVGTFLRRGKLTRYQCMQGYLIRKKLELLEHELEHDPFEPDEVKQVVRSIFATNSRWINSFNRT